MQGGSWSERRQIEAGQRAAAQLTDVKPTINDCDGMKRHKWQEAPSVKEAAVKQRET